MLKRLKRINAVQMLTRFVFWLVAKLPVNERLVMFESYSGKQYSCNPRAIYEYMREQKMDYTLIWSVKKQHERLFEENGVRYVRRLSLQWFLLMARAKFWVINSRMPNWVPKPVHTVYVQTWHGTPLKKLVADMTDVKMPGVTKQAYVKHFHAESSHWDYLISPNRYSSDIFRRAFQFKKEMLETGYPRNDVLTTKSHPDAIAALKKKFAISTDKKVFLYAPTWRDDEHAGPGAYTFQLQIDLDTFRETYGARAVLLVKLHSFISEKLDLSSYNDCVKDVSTYYDINELYLVSDMLITDYSSVFFDYANLGRPIIFFTYDLERYRDEVRGFYFSLEEEAPGPIVRTTEALLAAIGRFEEEGLGLYEDAYTRFQEKFCALEDGQATKRVVERVFPYKGAE
ncbi:CDP-glycerol glycerophosphotransferase family protein [Shouchella lonarensis]|uniref:CDP-glycerol glycerophosphotransferase n=1 Tax=Shouchella lonarensis TaxID=1464122 RepID=A0A1G6H0H3_9BACI|nr:CDP-glycerol glycerophosphotransferase family protein [Shouchella lonarensis]SDB87701.1 CDP-glycerol glycerophosphotransferase [Shouchella lonarensis]